MVQVSEGQALQTTVTIKVSKAVRDHVYESTEFDEPIDKTLRRLLGFKVDSGRGRPKGKLRKNHYSAWFDILNAARQLSSSEGDSFSLTDLEKRIASLPPEARASSRSTSAWIAKLVKWRYAVRIPAKSKSQDKVYTLTPEGRSVERASDMTTVKVTVSLRDHIATKAKWNESIDHTLRRLLKVNGKAEVSA